MPKSPEELKQDIVRALATLHEVYGQELVLTLVTLPTTVPFKIQLRALDLKEDWCLVNFDEQGDQMWDWCKANPSYSKFLEESGFTIKKLIEAGAQNQNLQGQ